MEKTREQIAQENRRNMLRCRYVAQQQQKADPSDPFVYDRVLNLLLNGTAELDDYRVDFVPEVWGKGTRAERTAVVPKNMRRV